MIHLGKIIGTELTRLTNLRDFKFFFCWSYWIVRINDRINDGIIITYSLIVYLLVGSDVATSLIEIFNFVLLSVLPVKIYTNTDTEKQKIKMKNLNPWFVTGFCDGESCFYIRISKNSKIKTGWRIQLVFSIGIHNKDKVLLEKIQAFLGGIGSITNQRKDVVQFQVSSIKDLEIIINHFDKYPLITQKLADYLLFKRAFELVRDKKHLTMEGLISLVGIKASLYWGLSDELKKAFPSVKPVLRPLVVNQIINDPQWLAGFTSAEGSFMIIVETSKQIRLRFQITQDSRDAALLKSFIEFFGCGKFYQESNRSVGNFVVIKLLDIDEKVISFFNKYSILGIKALDFADFCKASEIVKAGEHLTEEGFKKIMEIKARMNRNRN